MNRSPWRHRYVALALSVAAVWVTSTSLGPRVARAGQSSDLDSAAALFWAAASEEDFSAAINAVLATDLDIEAIWSRLRGGRTYSPDVPTGRQVLSRRNRDGVEHGYVLHVPDDYDPATRYPVRVYLHGGVMRPQRDDGGWWRNDAGLARDDSIIVIPASWEGSIWWQTSQIENLAGVVNDVKRVYNVDENRVYLLGISDGATGAFYHGFKATTPWAGLLTFNGHPVVLANAASNVDGEMHVTNLRNKPLFVINGGRDRLYPAASVSPFMQLFVDAGVFVDFRPQPDAGHDLSWWERESPAIDAFIERTPRRALPTRVSWQTESTDRYNRAHWLVITELGSVEGEPTLDAFNTVSAGVERPPLGINMLGELQDGTGLRVFEVGPDSIASAAGMEADDTIVAVDGGETPTVEDLKNALIGFAPGDQLPMTVERNGEHVEIVLDYPEGAEPEGRPAFPHRLPSGRVEISVTQRNSISARTMGVRRFTLLLSPEEFDFTQPIRVVTNGVESFEGMVEPDVGALLRWAAIDQDRTMMFGAELEIEVTSP